MSEVAVPSSSPEVPGGQDNSDDSGGENHPATVILGGAIIGASVLIVAIVIALIVLLGVRHRLGKRRRKASRTGAEEQRSPSHHSVTEREPSNGTPSQANPPLYAQISRQPPPVPAHTENSINGGLVNTNQPLMNEPRELLAFSDLSIPRTFKPYTPPPPITASAANLPEGSRVSSAIYDIPEAMFDDSPDFAIPSGYDMLTENTLSPEPRYDKLHDSGMLTASLNTDNPSLTASSSFQSSVTAKTSGDQSTGRKAAKANYNHTYSEQLEPSMLRHSVSPDSGSSVGLPYAPIYDIPYPRKRANEINVLNISRKNIVELRELGFGQFGRVILGATVGLSLRDLRLGQNDDPNTSLLVAIKKLRPDADNDLRKSFEKEISFASRMKHANVVRLLGVCRGSEGSFLMMEYMENGDMQGHLQKLKLVSDEVRKIGDNEVTPLLLLYMSVQIASGMRYLASRKFIHRDLAARNCLVGREFVVKISDFGMSHNLYESLYYRVQGRLILPIRWMAYESFYGQFSVKSDVWSYGVTIWEVFELARFEPYHRLPDEEYIADAIKGAARAILPRPKACPKEVYEILRRCWVHDPIMRADFEEVYSRLFLTYTNLSKQYAR